MMLPGAPISINDVMHTFENGDEDTYESLFFLDPTQEEDAERASVRERVQHALSMLDERERTIISYRFKDDMTLEAIGNRIGLSRERVRQIQDNCLVKLAGLLRDLAR